MDCSKTGCFSFEDLDFPDENRLKQGAVAIIECAQEIPCNPCSEFCPRGAITVGENINACPKIDWAICNGCGLCLGYCPGLALFLVDNSLELPRITLPYELPTPKEGQPVTLLSRGGESLGLGRVVACRHFKKHDRCTLVTLELEHPELLRTVRGFREVTP